MDAQVERRYLALPQADIHIETRADGGPSMIAGHAAVFYDGTERTEYDMWGLFERIMPGAFDRALSEQDDVRALFNHDPNYLLGRVSAGSLRLSSDPIGLGYEIPVDLGDPDFAKVVAKIQRGDLKGSSFSFVVPPGGERYLKQDGREVREITSVELYDVGPVTFPAYKATDTSLRAWAESWVASHQKKPIDVPPEGDRIQRGPSIALLRRRLDMRK